MSWLVSTTGVCAGRAARGRRRTSDQSLLAGAGHGSLAPVLRQVAEGVLIHESEFCQSNAVVVQGRTGLLRVDPGVLAHEMAARADDLREVGQPVAAGFSTHGHGDHLLFLARFGAAR